MSAIDKVKKAIVDKYNLPIENYQELSILEFDRIIREDYGIIATRRDMEEIVEKLTRDIISEINDYLVSNANLQ